MAAPRKYPEELRERATRLAVEARRDPASRSGGVVADRWAAWDQPRDAAELGDQAEIDQGHRRGTSTSDAEKIAELERDNRELRRTNSILRTASAFFAAELDRPFR